MKQIGKILAVSLLFIAFNSCQKKDSTTTDEATLSQQETQGEEALNDVDLLVDEAVDSNTGQLKSAIIGSAMYLTDFLHRQGWKSPFRKNHCKIRFIYHFSISKNKNI